MIGRILVSLEALALGGFAVLVLIGLWDRYSQETAALGFRGNYERYLASRAGFPKNPKAYRAAAEAERERQSRNVVGETTALSAPHPGPLAKRKTTLSEFLQGITVHDLVRSATKP